MVVARVKFKTLFFGQKVSKKAKVWCTGLPLFLSLSCRSSLQFKTQRNTTKAFLFSSTHTPTRRAAKALKRSH